MILAAHQPNYLPWLGYIYKMAQADVFVLADDVQYTKHGYINRNRVRTHDGWQWMTVPVRSRGRAGQRICDVEISTEQAWARKHLQTIEWNYRNAPFYDMHASFLHELLQAPPARLLDLNVRLMRYALAQLDLDTRIRLSSEMTLRPERSQRLADMARACNCDVYLAGDGGSRQYLDEHVLQAAGIDVQYVGFDHPRYPQCHAGFEAGMCVFDLLFNCGPRSREVLLG